MSNPIILAFSGGLDTSFCIPYLQEQGYQVHTVFADTGGVSEQVRTRIEQRALTLGVASHVTMDGRQAVWRNFVVPFIWAGECYQGQYPLLVSDRYFIVDAMIARARELGTNTLAHGCTGMGNDQVRFDLAIKSRGDFAIVAPIREIQKHHPQTRDYELAYLAARGHLVQAEQQSYSINENILGITLSGSEIDRWQRPMIEAQTLCAPPKDWPQTPLEVTLSFRQGCAIRLQGQDVAGPDLLGQLNRLFGQYGVGRGIYTGDTVIGLKGRIVFEAPGLTALLVAHRALEEAVLTKQQNRFKPFVARQWVELVYEGFFYDPLKADLEAYLRSSQVNVSGEVTLATNGADVSAVAIKSPYLLQATQATYAQSADWGSTEAEGFIRLFGMSSTTYAHIHHPHRQPTQDSLTDDSIA